MDVLSGMARSVVIPTKARAPYSQAELRRFALETGRTFGVLQCDPEPALGAIATSVTGEVGGLTFRSTPVGWKQAQGTAPLTFRCTLHFSLGWCDMRSGL